MANWWTSKDGHYKYPKPYVTNDITRTYHEVLDISRPKICPHCNGNHAGLQGEGFDLYCFSCGWREAAYFNNKLFRFIKWIEKREKKYGSPILLTNHETIVKAREYKFRQGYKEALKIYQKKYREDNLERLRLKENEYVANHKAEKKIYHKQYYEERKVELAEKQRCYNKEHKEHRREYDRNRYLIKRGGDTR